MIRARRAEGLEEVANVSADAEIAETPRVDGDVHNFSGQTRLHA